MKDLAIITFIVFFIYTISQVVDIQNAALSYIVNIIPIIIPTFALWKYTPRNYLKFMSLKSNNISYDLTLKLSECPLDINGFKEVRNTLMNIYNNMSDGRILNENLGEILYISTIEIDTTLIELRYNINMQELFISSRDKIKYKLFFKVSQSLLSSLQSIFTSRDRYYETILINLKISFKDDTIDCDCRNPFSQKIFSGFQNKLVSFKYETKNKSLVEISNNNINFVSDNLDTINDDIRKELTFFLLRN